jgi:hypothetical protein
MFVKYGDNTENFTIQKTATICESCNQQKIIINEKLSCKCSENKNFEKSKKILTQENVSTNFQGNKRVENV